MFSIAVVQHPEGLIIYPTIINQKAAIHDNGFRIEAERKMLFFIFIGLIALFLFIWVVYINSDFEFKSERQESVVGIIGACSLFIGVVGFLVTLVLMLIVATEPYNPDEVYDVKTKATTAELNSVKYSGCYYNCIIGTTGGEYVKTVCSAVDTKITIKKDISPRIETIKYTGKMGYSWVIPFTKEKQSTEYHLYIPVDHPDRFQIN